MICVLLIFRTALLTIHNLSQAGACRMEDYDPNEHGRLGGIYFLFLLARSTFRLLLTIDISNEVHSSQVLGILPAIGIPGLRITTMPQVERSWKGRDSNSSIAI